MERYHIYYRKYNIFANDYIPYIKIIYTDDIYHEIGKMICTSLEKIESIRYTKSKASKEDCEKLWTERGYQKVDDKLWRLSDSAYRERKMRRMDEYNCGDCARFYSVDEWNGECSKHGCVSCMSKICKDFILNDMRKEDEEK